MGRKAGAYDSVTGLGSAGWCDPGDVLIDTMTQFVEIDNTTLFCLLLLLVRFPLYSHHYYMHEYLT